jgi:4-hydroxy-4-methyl-2-oxoglutarate aldolase
MTRMFTARVGVCAAALLAPVLGHAQLWTWTKEQMLEYTKAWTGDRFPDGRPKVPNALINRARGLSQEEITINWGAQGAMSAPAAPTGGGGRGGMGGGRGTPYSQFDGDWQVLHPGKKMVGRAFTCAFMPARPDLDAVVTAKAREKGVQVMNNQYCIDQLQPGDVLVIDLMGRKEGGTIVGDNLFYYVMKATKGGGLVVDGAIRDLEGIAEMDMPAYFRHTHPTAIGGVTLAAVNVPVRIGNVTVMPGDLVVGDREGVAFIPPQLAQSIIDAADTTHVHDEWTRKKFDEGKYKSSEIYGSPRDPALLKEYKEYLEKRLEEIRKGQK